MKNLGIKFKVEQSFYFFFVTTAIGAIGLAIAFSHSAVQPFGSASRYIGLGLIAEIIGSLIGIVFSIKKIPKESGKKDSSETGQMNQAVLSKQDKRRKLFHTITQTLFVFLLLALESTLFVIMTFAREALNLGRDRSHNWGLPIIIGLMLLLTVGRKHWLESKKEHMWKMIILIGFYAILMILYYFNITFGIHA